MSGFSATFALDGGLPHGPVLHGHDDGTSVHTGTDLLVVVAGHPRDGDDASTLADRYRAQGERCIASPHGSFACAIHDKRERRAILAADRIGVMPLYYARRGGMLHVATDLDTLRGLLDPRPDIDPQALHEYLWFHAVPAPRTIWRDVSRLLPAERVRFDAHGEHHDFWWSIAYREGESARPDFGAMREEFRALLADCVRDALPPNGRRACFLSGGTDSSTVAGTAARLGGELHTYSIGFDAEGYDESFFARTAAAHFGAIPHEHRMTPAEALTAIPAIARWYDQPFGNASALPTLRCARLAHDDGARVILAGDGGDEIFGGNARYAAQKVFGYYSRVPGFVRHGVIEPLLAHAPWVKRIPGFGKAFRYADQARVPLPDRLESWNFLARAARAAVFTPEFLAVIEPEAPLAVLRGPWARTDGRDPVNRMMHLDMKITLADNDLRKVSGMCALAGMEARYPLLDERMVEFAARLPPEWKVQGMKLRWFFKEALADFLPRETLTKKKHGFGLPFGLWLARDPALNALARDSLAALSKRNIVRADYIDRLVAQHRDEDASYYGVMIWVLMMLELWLAGHATPS